MDALPAIWVLNGPNLNRLGRREPQIYGTQTLDDIIAALADQAAALGVALAARQSNHEGHLIDWLHEAEDAGVAAVLLNAGGLTHSSIALRDAVSAIVTPVYEVHLSDPATREPFRQVNVLHDVCVDRFVGKGAASYAEALAAAAARIASER